MAFWTGLELYLLISFHLVDVNHKIRLTCAEGTHGGTWHLDCHVDVSTP